ncbi:MAG: serine hydrolase [Planctomycetes bacterium]|nr:serine hydrolase [Planctomycetota bacterium]
MFDRFFRPHLLASAMATLFATAASAQVVSYHGVSSAAHQTQFTTLSGQGYRLISLAVAGGASAATYTAVWEQVNGPAWVAAHGMTASQYATTRANWIRLGYRAKCISVAGSGTNTVYAAVFVDDGASVTDNHTYTWTAFVNACATAQANDRIPVSVDIHGTTTTPLYSAVFEPNTRDTAWGYNLDTDHTDWTETYDAHTPAGARLGCLGMSDAQDYLSVWYDDRIGSTAVRSNYTAAGFGTQVTTLGNANYDLLCVAAGGSGSSLRIAGGFATLRTPQNRVFTATGQARAEFNAFDQYMASKMTSERARAGSIAIAKDGRLVFARSYTWAEPGYPITQPTSLFRVASLAKVPTAIAAHELDERNLLAMSSRPQALLNIPFGSGDPRFANITVQHCLEYRSGLPRNYSPVTIAQWYYGQFSAPTILPALRAFGENWLGTQALEFTPGTFADYANSGHFLVGQVVEDIAGVPLQTFLQNEIYAPLGITRARTAASTTGQLVTGETLSHLRELTLSGSELHTDRRRLASQYATDLGFKNASGGTSFSTVDYVRLIAGVLDLGADTIVTNATTRTNMLARHSYSPGTEGPGDVCPLSMSWSTRPNGVFAYHKGGTLDSSSASLDYRTDGVTIAVFFNQGDAHASDTSLHMFTEAISTWPTDDLFPTYGLPSFPRRPELTGFSPSSLNNIGNTPFLLQGERLDLTTSVQCGLTTITSQSPTTWRNGYFLILSPTTIALYLPQGLLQGNYTVRASNAQGSSSPVNVAVLTNGNFQLGSPIRVGSNQTFDVMASRGALSANAFCVFGISTSNLPSVTPGVISLDIGNQWSSLLTSPLTGFDPITRAATFVVPPLPFPLAYFQATALDGNSPNPFPLPVTNVRQVQRQ